MQPLVRGGARRPVLAHLGRFVWLGQAAQAEGVGRGRCGGLGVGLRV